MSEESGFEIARAWVAVDPDASDFADSLDEQVGGLTVTAVVAPDASDFAQSFDEQVGGLSVTATVGADITAARSSVDSFIEETSNSQALLQVGAVITGALTSAQVLAGEIDGLTADLTVNAVTAPASSQVDVLLAEIEAALADVSVGADTAAASETVAELVAEIGGLRADILVGADTAPADAAVASLLDDVNAGRADLSVGADTGRARAQAESLAGEISGLSGDVSVNAVGADSSGVTALTGDMDELTDAAGHAASGLTGVQGAIDGVQSAAENAAGAFAGITGALSGGLGGVAHVAVTPDLSGFDSAVTEAGGGTEIRARVIPDMSDFAQQVEEETGGTVARVLLEPDAADFESRVEESTGGLTARVLLVPDAEGTQERIDAELGGLTARVTVEADVTQAEEAARSFAGSATGAFAEVESAGRAAAEDLESYWAAPRILTGLPQSSQAAVDALNGLKSTAAEDAGLIEQDFASVEGEAARLGEALAGLDADFTRYALGHGDTFDEGIASVHEQLETLYDELDAASGHLASLRGSFDEAGGAFTGMDEGLGNVSGALRDFDSNLTIAQGDMADMGGAWLDLDGQASRFGTTIDELPAKIDAAFAAYVTGQDNAKAALIALNDDSGKVAAIGTDAELAAGKVEGLAGSFGGIIDRMSYMAVDPFMWMLAAPLLFKGLEGAVASLDDSVSPMAQKLTDAANKASWSQQSWDNLANSITSSAKGVGALGSVTEQEAGAIHEAGVKLSGDMSDLEQKYGLTAQQAAVLAQQAGVLPKTLADGGTAAHDAMQKIIDLANANIAAQDPITRVAGDMQTFGSNVETTADKITALDEAYNILVGNFVGEQQDMLTVQQGFNTLANDLTAAGATMTGTNQASVALQQAFFSQVTSIQDTVDAMKKQGDTTQQITSYINDQTDKLSKYTQGSTAAKSAVAGLTTESGDLAQATKVTTAEIDTASSHLATQFTAQLKAAGDMGKNTKSDIDKLTSSILATGTTSQQTAGIRAQLIQDLKNSGKSAQDATGLVDGFIKKIGGIPKDSYWTLKEQATGTWAVAEQQQDLITVPGSNKAPGVTLNKAGGGLIQGGSGKRGADDIPAYLSHGEYVVQSDAVDKYGVGMMDAINARHFADGGLADSSYSGAVDGAGAWATGQVTATEKDLAVILEGKAAGAAKAAAAKSAASAGGGSSAGAPTSGVAAQNMAALKAAAAAHGWTGAEWDALNSVEMMEAGYRLDAKNPGSDAYGMAQFINGPGEYAQYGGNAQTAAGQATAMTAYIAQRYGDPEAALAHEEADHYYQNGSWSVPETGPAIVHQDEMVLPAGVAADVRAGLASGGGSQRPVVVNQYFTGPSHPTPEMQQAMIMQLTQQVAMA